TRSYGDWSSDVCSSDLDALGMTTSYLAKPVKSGMRTCRSGLPPVTQADVTCAIPAAQPEDTSAHSAPVNSANLRATASISSSRRSEERRVGKECKARWW